MMRRNAVAVALLLVAATYSEAKGGSAQGQSKDLNNIDVGDLTVVVRSAQGAILSQAFFSNGNFNVPLNGFPANNQGAVLEFSSPGRQTVTATLSTARDNLFDVALPIAQKCCASCRGWRCRR
jgi:hypothetical protein